MAAAETPKEKKKLRWSFFNWGLGFLFFGILFFSKGNDEVYATIFLFISVAHIGVSYLARNQEVLFQKKVFYLSLLWTIPTQYVLWVLGSVFYQLYRGIEIWPGETFRCGMMMGSRACTFVDYLGNAIGTVLFLDIFSGGFFYAITTVCLISAISAYRVLLKN